MRLSRFVCFVIVALQSLVAQAITVRGQVDRNPVGVGETFQYTISVSSEDRVDIEQPELPLIQGFQILGQNTSSSASTRLVQGPNGMEMQSSRTTEFIFSLQAEKAGAFKLPPIAVRVEGEEVLTESIPITVVNQPTVGRGNRGGSQGRAQPLDPFDEADQLFQQLLQQRAQIFGGQLPGQEPDAIGSPAMKNPAFRSLPKNTNEALFVQLELDKTTAFAGEQITANWYVYVRGNVLSLDRLKFPDLKGFWKEIIEEIPNLNFVPETVNGVQYRKALIASHALFPISAGRAVIDEYKVKSKIQLPASPFGQFAWGQPYEYSRSSARVDIKVKPLPLEGQPANFAGAVGEFQVFAQPEQNAELKAYQPFVLKVRFEGAGNAKLIELPSMTWPQEVELFDTKFESKFFKNGTSFKEFKLTLVPKVAGPLKIPALEFSYFDPRQEKYVSIRSAPLELQVAPGEKPADYKPGELPQVQKQELKKNWRPQFLSLNSEPAFRFRFNWWTGLLCVGLALAYLLTLAKKELWTGLKKKSLLEGLNLRMKNVRTQVKNKELQMAATGMMNNFYFVVGHISGAGGAPRQLEDLLSQAPPSLMNEYGEQIRKQMQSLEAVLFAPKESGNSVTELQLENQEKLLLELIEKGIE